MITTITGTGIIEAATVTPIMTTISGTKITITITRRRRHKPEGEAGSHNRWVALFKFKTNPKIYLFTVLTCGVWLWHSVGGRH